MLRTRRQTRKLQRLRLCNRPAKSEANKMKDLILVGSYGSSRLQISSPASRKKHISQEPCLLNWILIPWKAETLEAAADRRDKSLYLSPISSSAIVFISRWLQISCNINSKTISWKRLSLNWLQVKRSSWKHFKFTDSPPAGPVTHSWAAVSWLAS